MSGPIKRGFAGLLLAVIKSLRPWQWMKNTLLFAPLLFSYHLLDVPSITKSLAAFSLFCLISGAIYVLNDVLDRERDRHHPIKALRPIASGQIPVWGAIVLFSGLSIFSLALAAALPWTFFSIMFVYFLMQCSYCLGLKRVVILDVLIVSMGFLLRIAAGAEVIEVSLSSWILLCTFFLALFIALNKRRHEIGLLKQEAVHHRRVLAEYTTYLLDQMIAVVTASSVITYTLYTRSPETVEKHHTPLLIYTVPFVVYGIFRYLYLVHKKKAGGAPELVIVTDPPLLADIFLWAVTITFILYR